MLPGSLDPVAADAAQRGALLLLLLFALLASGAVAALALRAGLARHGPGAGRSPLANPARQVEVVSALRFEAIPLMGEGERRLFRLIEAAAGELAPGCRLLARVSLDEVVRPRSATGRDWDQAMASIRSKRLDFALFDGEGRIVAAFGCAERVRMIGEGREKVRRGALAGAGIPYLPLAATTTVEEICLSLHRLGLHREPEEALALPAGAPADRHQHQLTQDRGMASAQADSLPSPAPVPLLPANPTAPHSRGEEPGSPPLPTLASEVPDPWPATAPGALANTQEPAASPAAGLQDQSGPRPHPCAPAGVPSHPHIPPAPEGTQLSPPSAPPRGAHIPPTPTEGMQRNRQPGPESAGESCPIPRDRSPDGPLPPARHRSPWAEPPVPMSAPLRRLTAGEP